MQCALDLKGKNLTKSQVEGVGAFGDKQGNDNGISYYWYDCAVYSMPPC